MVVRRGAGAELRIVLGAAARGSRRRDHVDREVLEQGTDAEAAERTGEELPERWSARGSGSPPGAFVYRAGRSWRQFLARMVQSCSGRTGFAM